MASQQQRRRRSKPKNEQEEKPLLTVKEELDAEKESDSQQHNLIGVQMNFIGATDDLELLQMICNELISAAEENGLFYNYGFQLPVNLELFVPTPGSQLARIVYETKGE